MGDKAITKWLTKKYDVLSCNDIEDILKFIRVTYYFIPLYDTKVASHIKKIFNEQTNLDALLLIHAERYFIHNLRGMGLDLSITPELQKRINHAIVYNKLKS